MRVSNLRHFAPISGVATSKGSLIATAGYDNQIILWNAKTGMALTRVSHDHLVNQCEFSLDGKFLASASSDYSARVWSVPDMKLLFVLNGHSDDVIKVSFSPDNERIATCSYDGTLRIFDQSGNCLILLEGHTGLIETFDWNIDGTEIFSCGTDGTIKTWCTHTGKVKHIYDGFEYDIDSLISFGKDGFIFGNDKGEIITCRNEKMFVQKAHKAGIKRLVSYDDLLLSAGYDHKVVLWKVLSDGKLNEICSDQLPASVWARAASFLNPNTIIFASFGSTYISWKWTEKVWDYNFWQPSRSKNALVVKGSKTFSTGDSGLVFKNEKLLVDCKSLCNCISLVGNHCFVAGQLGAIFDALDHKIIFQHTSSINCCASYINHGEDTVVFGTYDGALIFISFEDGKLEPTNICTLKLECNAIKGVAILGDHILCGSADGKLILVDSVNKTVKSIQENAHNGIVNGVATYRNGFLTVSRDRTMRLWDQEGKLQKILETRHSKSIRCVASSSNGQLTASGSYGGTIDIYDHVLNNWIGEIRRPTMSGISAIAWSDHLSCFIATSYDGCLYYV